MNRHHLHIHIHNADHTSPSNQWNKHPGLLQNASASAYDSLSPSHFLLAHRSHRDNLGHSQIPRSKSKDILYMRQALTSHHQDGVILAYHNMGEGGEPPRYDEI
jgi:hypothetical protein